MFDYFSKERGLNNLIWFLGYDGSPSAEYKKDNAMWSWFMIWDSFVQKVDTTHLKNVYNSDLVITLDKLPNWTERLKGVGTLTP